MYLCFVFVSSKTSIILLHLIFLSGQETDRVVPVNRVPSPTIVFGFSENPIYYNPHNPFLIRDIKTEEN
jgi:hypothetical protein